MRTTSEESRCSRTPDHTLQTSRAKKASTSRPTLPYRPHRHATKLECSAGPPEEVNLSDQHPTQRAGLTMVPYTLCTGRFQVLFTLFSKFFSSFVHTTCSLSVSKQYLAFAEAHQRFCTAFPNCTTLGRMKRYRSRTVSACMGR